MNFAYNFTRQSSLRINYNGNTQQPTIQQIQPIANNDDPLNIVVGNAGLRPQFSNNFRIGYNSYNEMSQRYVNVNLRAGFTEDAISNNSYVDSVGRRVTRQSVNVNGNYNFGGYMSFGFKWKKPEIDIGLSPNFNINRNASIVNNTMNVTNSCNYTMELYMNKYKEKKYGIGFSANATYTQSTSSIPENVKTTYWTYNLRPLISIWFLPLKIPDPYRTVILISDQKTAAFRAITQWHYGMLPCRRNL